MKPPWDILGPSRGVYTFSAQFIDSLAFVGRGLGASDGIISRPSGDGSYYGYLGLGMGFRGAAGPGIYFSKINAGSIGLSAGHLGPS